VDIVPALNPLTVTIPNGSRVQSTHNCKLAIPELPEKAQIGHIVPGLASKSLVSVIKLCNAGCEATFTKIECIVKPPDTNINVPDSRWYHWHPRAWRPSIQLITLRSTCGTISMQNDTMRTQASMKTSQPTSFLPVTKRNWSDIITNAYAPHPILRCSRDTLKRVVKDSSMVKQEWRYKVLGRKEIKITRWTRTNSYMRGDAIDGTNTTHHVSLCVEQDWVLRLELVSRLLQQVFHPVLNKTRKSCSRWELYNGAQSQFWTGNHCTNPFTWFEANQIDF